MKSTTTETGKRTAARSVLTVGHSNHEPEAFTELLQTAGVDLIIDVRSQPYSRYATHFNRSALQSILAASAIDYRHQPDLGGRPDDPAMYDAAGHVLYGLVAESPQFLTALEQVEAAAATLTVAVMCGEENPQECHRRLLVGRVLKERGWTVRHLRGDGRIEQDEDLPDGTAVQEGLFEGGEFSAWRSIRSVSPRNPQPNSSDY